MWTYDGYIMCFVKQFKYDLDTPYMIYTQIIRTYMDIYYTCMLEEEGSEEDIG